MTEGRAGITWRGVCVDCFDAEELASFYGRILGWPISGGDTLEDGRGGAGWIGLSNPEAGVGLSFQAEQRYEPPCWPEEDGTPTEMMHFEGSARDLEAAAAQVTAPGGRQAVLRPADRDPTLLRVMLDPAGHPFCLGSE